MSASPAMLRLMSDLKAIKQEPPEVGCRCMGITHLCLRRFGLTPPMPLPPLQGCSASPASDDNLFVWNATIFGPDDTPWEGVLASLTRAAQASLLNQCGWQRRGCVLAARHIRRKVPRQSATGPVRFRDLPSKWCEHALAATPASSLRVRLTLLDWLDVQSTATEASAWTSSRSTGPRSRTSAPC